MNVALIQQHCSNDRQENLERGVRNLRAAISHGAEVICFAELSFDRFFPQFPDHDDSESLAEAIPGPTTQALADVAAEHGVIIIPNIYESDDSAAYDTSAVIGTQGELLGKTRMAHIADFNCFHEKRYYTPGPTDPPVYDTPFGKIGIAVCFDRHFPEYMRALALKGAEVVFVPQAGADGEWDDGVFEAEMQTASFQNGYFTALCNRVGPEERLTFAGSSFICNPSGKIICKAKNLEDEILYATLDTGECASSPARKLFLPERKSGYD